jgi:hypothetical protein
VVPISIQNNTQAIVRRLKHQSDWERAGGSFSAQRCDSASVVGDRT